MKFNEKLQNLRKESKMSQEQLAEKLNVSRQSVSKWESGQSYPEMDKLLSMCKIFNVSLEDLTNDQVKEINNNSKNAFSGFVDQVKDLFSRTIDMITNIGASNLIRCTFELLILMIILSFFRNPFVYLNNLAYDIFASFPKSICQFLHSTFYFVTMVIYFILFVFVVIFFFQKRWLERYEQGVFSNDSKQEENDESNEDDNDDEETDEDEEQEEKIKPCEKKRNYVRHSEQSGMDKVFGCFWTIVLFFIKFVALCVAFPLCITMMVLVACMIVNIVLIFNGVYYFGLLLCFTFITLILYVIVRLIFNVIFNNKMRITRLFVLFIIGILGLGISGGVIACEFASTKFIDSTPSSEKEVKEYEFDMEDGLYLNIYDNIKAEYVVDDDLKDIVKVNITYSKNMINASMSKRRNSLYLYIGNDYNQTMELVKSLIEDLKKREVHNYDAIFDDYKLTIISSEYNINSIKNNTFHYFD